jgi:hypothetical protein
VNSLPLSPAPFIVQPKDGSQGKLYNPFSGSPKARKARRLCDLNFQSFVRFMLAFCAAFLASPSSA